MRKSTELNHKLKAVSPFFYKQCWKCKDKVRKEPVWRFKAFHAQHDGINAYTVSENVYVCMECVPELEEMEKIIGTKFNRTFLGKLPSSMERPFISPRGQSGEIKPKPPKGYLETEGKSVERIE